MDISAFTTARRKLATVGWSALSGSLGVAWMWHLDLSTNQLLVSKAARDKFGHTFIMIVRKAVAWVRGSSQAENERKICVGYTSLVNWLEDQKRFRQKFLRFIDFIVLNRWTISPIHRTESLCGQRCSLESMIRQIIFSKSFVPRCLWPIVLE